MSGLFTFLADASLAECLAARAPAAARAIEPDMLAPVDPKVRYFCANVLDREPQDLDWLRSVTRDWLTLASASNPS